MKTEARTARPESGEEEGRISDVFIIVLLIMKAADFHRSPLGAPIGASPRLPTEAPPDRAGRTTIRERANARPLSHPAACTDPPDSGANRLRSENLKALCGPMQFTGEPLPHRPLPLELLQRQNAG